MLGEEAHRDDPCWTEDCKAWHSLLQAADRTIRVCSQGVEELCNDLGAQLCQASDFALTNLTAMESRLQIMDEGLHRNLGPKPHPLGASGQSGAINCCPPEWVEEEKLATDASQQLFKLQEVTQTDLQTLETQVIHVESSMGVLQRGLAEDLQIGLDMFGDRLEQGEGRARSWPVDPPSGINKGQTPPPP